MFNIIFCSWSTVVGVPSSQGVLLDLDVFSSVLISEIVNER